MNLEKPDRYCTTCRQILSNQQSFLCKKGYWSSTSPHTIQMERDMIVRPENCVKDAAKQLTEAHNESQASTRQGNVTS